MLKQPHAGLKWVNLGSKHDGAGMAAATPVTDGKFIYYVFGTGLGVCCDLETGKRLWYNKLEGELGYQHHRPAIAGGRIYCRNSGGDLVCVELK